MKKLIFLLLLLVLNLDHSQAAKKRKKVYKIRDKITLISHPLMKQARLSGDAVVFKWSEPHHDFQYFLEVFRDGHKKPISTLRVSGGQKIIRFKKKEKKRLLWRVYAKSQYGNKTTNKKLMLVPLKY